METNEKDLVRRCQSGDLAAFGELYDAYAARIYNFIYYRTHHKQTAEDITSVVFTKALEKVDSFNSGKASFSTWLHQIARNTVIDHYRSHRETADLEDVWDVPSNANVERDADARAQLETVAALLRKLTREQRELVIMRVWDGLSYREISQIVGKTEAGLKVSFSRIMAGLQKEAAVALVVALVAMSRQF